MSRKRVSWAVQRQRQVLVQQRAYERALRDQERASRAAEREQLRLDKTRHREYLESRAGEAEEVRAAVDEMARLLTESLDEPARIDFATLTVHEEVAPFDPGPLGTSTPPPDPETYHVAPLGAFGRLVPGAQARHAEAVSASEAAYAVARSSWEALEQQRVAALNDARRAYDSQLEAARTETIARETEVANFQHGFEAGDPSSVVQYFSVVLDRSQYPEPFPRQHRVAYVPDSKQLVIEFQFPPSDIVPAAKDYRYVRHRDDIEPISRPLAQIRSMYADLIGQLTLRTISEVLRADYPGAVETIVVNGFVHTIDPATGQPKSPYLITVRVSRETFLALDLRQVDPIACLKKLNAGVSRSPVDLEPVRPVLEFSMVDRRFIEETDVLSTLDQRPNLMDLSPKEFEGLITNLFEKMGLETRQTQASRDGGVDCVAFDNRPIFGGKVIIQAKRYKNTVGVSAVRDLFGTVQNEGASKGILVTTSGYGAASFEFAAGKPLELLTGANLLALLEDHAGLQARIEPPETWVDPVPDAPGAM
jgi:restriction system protein